MKLKVIILCVFFLAVTVVISKSRKKCQQLNKRIQIFRPQGLELKQNVADNLQYIEVEVYINQKNQTRRSYDIWANATVAHGQKQLTIRHPSIVILPRDTFEYNITEHYRYGPPKRFSCVFHVQGERMKFVRKPILRSCPVLRPKPATSSKKRNYAAEKALLEEKINDLLSFCEGTRVTKQLVLTDDYKGEQSVKALKRYVLDRLNSLHPSVDWDETVENVYLSQEKIVFDVKSELMKLKILHSIRGTDVAKNIVDYEELILSADDYEESSGDYDA